MNRLFKALDDPTRRKILELLKNGDMSAGDIGAQFSMTAASISHHLSVLKNADLVIDEKQGQNVYYSLNTTVFQSIIEWLYSLKGDKNE